MQVFNDNLLSTPTEERKTFILLPERWDGTGHGDGVG